MAPEILVLGATGMVGRHVAEELARRGVPARLASRTPAALVTAGDTEVVDFDLTRPETFDGALRGMRKVFLLARPGDDAPQRHALPLLAAMQRHGVRHVVHLSALGAERRPDFGLRGVELALEQSGMAFTQLRPNFFFQVFLSPLVTVRLRARHELALAAGEARVSYVDAADVGLAAAAALCERGHENASYSITGSEALEHHAVARIFAASLGRPVRYVSLDDDELRSTLAQAGLPSAWQERLVGFYQLVRAGACAEVSPDLERLIGRPPRKLESFGREQLAAALR